MTQYKTVRCFKNNLETECNHAGQDGWRRSKVEVDIHDDDYILIEFARD